MMRLLLNFRAERSDIPTMSMTIQTRDPTARLRAVGLRPTRQRITLAPLLFGSCDRHITAEQLHAEATAADARVSLATVYHTLHQFMDAVPLREVTAPPRRSWLDTNPQPHHPFPN